ncbi:hypothetical protein CLOP_g21313 [Closterium sp. NIES-67]|nr:hypothetical protein CLOP_g21313 [Closterium sp. NIES-67]
MVTAFCWNLSLSTLVFPLALFLYALVSNPSPGRDSGGLMLVYSEILIALEYLYQIPTHDSWMDRLLAFIGIRPYPSWFVWNVLPLFAVYLALLVQTSIRYRNSQSKDSRDSKKLAEPEEEVRFGSFQASGGGSGQAGCEGVEETGERAGVGRRGGPVLRKVVSGAG